LYAAERIEDAAKLALQRTRGVLAAYDLDRDR